MIGAKVRYWYGPTDNEEKTGTLAGFASESCYDEGDMIVFSVAIILIEDGSFRTVDVSRCQVIS